MDLVESGAIFNFRPFNSQRSRDNGRDDTFNSSASKTNSRFEELFLASPRAQEVLSTIDHQSLSASHSRSKISFSTKQQSFLNDSPQTPITTKKSDNSTPDLTNSGLVVNMLEFLKSGQHQRNQSVSLFSPFKTPDYEEDSLKSQVTDVISKLRTPMTVKDAVDDSNDHACQSLNTDSGYDDRHVQCNSDLVSNGGMRKSDLRSMSSDVAKQLLPGSCLEFGKESNNMEYLTKPQAGELVEDEEVDIEDLHASIKTIDNTSQKTPKKFLELEEENMECDLIPGQDISDNNPDGDDIDSGENSSVKDVAATKAIVNVNPEKTSHDKENIPLNSLSENKEPKTVKMISDVQPNKKAHHLFGWRIKPLKTKYGSSIVVEGQRHEDPIGELWHSSAIVKRISALLVETKSKSQYSLNGEILANETIEQGFSKQFVEAFKDGFPKNWEQLVKDHFESIYSPPSTNKEKASGTRKKSSTKKQIHSQKSTSKKRYIARNKTPKKTDVMPIEVELKRTSSGRLIKPPLAWWRGQRIKTDADHNLTAIEPGGEEHTALSIGLYNFDLKVPKENAEFLKSKEMTPKIAKFELSAQLSSNKKVPVKTRKKDIKDNKKSSAVSNDSESELTDSTSTSVHLRKSGNPYENTSSSQVESDMTTLPGLLKQTHGKSDDSWRPSESDSTTAIETSRKVSLKSKKTQPTIVKKKLANLRKKHDKSSVEESGEDGDNEDIITTESVKRNISFSDEEFKSKSTLQKSPQKKRFEHTNDGKKPNSNHVFKKAKVLLKRYPSVTRNRTQLKKQGSADSDSTVQSENNNKEEDNDAVNSTEDILRGDALVKGTSKMKFKKPAGLEKGSKKQKPKVQSCTESSEDDNLTPQRQRVQRNQRMTRSRYKSMEKERYANKPLQTSARYGSKVNHQSIVEEEENSLSSSDGDEAEALAEMLSRVRQRKAYANSQNDTLNGESSSDTECTTTSKKKYHHKATKKSRNQGQNGKKKESSDRNLGKENGSNLEEKDWQDDELFRLSKALHSLPLSTPGFWQKISDSVQTRTAQECQLMYDEQLNCRPRKGTKTKEKQPKPNQKVIAITGGVGTIKRKRELRQLIQQNNDGYEDDIFESTPYRTAKKKFKFLDKKDENSIENDEDAEEEEDIENHNQLGFKTPSSRTPSSRYRPLGPANSSLNTPTSDLISPSLLQPVNREGMDLYIHRMKQGKKGVGQQRKQDKMKMVKTSTPKKIAVSKVPKVNGSLFDVQEVLEKDSDDENDYYWSDE